MKFPGPRLHLAALGVLALIFGAGGIGKLMSMPQFHEGFQTLQWPSWAGYTVGGLEVLGVIALLMPSLRKPAALGLGAIAAGAVWFHVTHPPVSAGALAFTALIACLLILLFRPTGVHR